MSEKVLLTGALGCIGAWVTKSLVDRGDEAAIFDLGDDTRRLRDVISEENLQRVELLRGDISSLEEVRGAFSSTGARKVIHLAGLQVPFCKADPSLGARVNVVGTVNVFQGAQEAGLERVVYASSAAVYGPPEDDRAPDESSACVPTTHYGVYKRANEESARIFWQDDRLSSVGIRPLTVYGVGRDQGLTSGPTTAMKAAVLGRPYTIGFSGATDFNYVADTAAVFVACADAAPEGAHVFNLHGDTVGVETIVEQIRACAETGAADGVSFEGPPLPIPPQLDGAALGAAIGPLPSTPLDEGIRWTMQRFAELRDEGRLDTRDLDA